MSSDPVLKFWTTADNVEDAVEPVPANRAFPEWFASLAPNDAKRKDDGFGMVATAKKCMGLLDAMSLGYVLRAQYDYTIRVEDGEFSTPPGSPDIQGTHSPEQMGDQYAYRDLPILILENRWGIETPDGYSALFTHPMNHFDVPYRAFSGAVDTDVYDTPLTIPLQLMEDNHEYHIEKGDPLWQVIPFKRDDGPVREAEIEVRPEEERIKTDIRDNEETLSFYRLQDWQGGKSARITNHPEESIDPTDGDGTPPGPDRHLDT